MILFWCAASGRGLSSIGFKSCDQGRSVFQGTSLDWVWFKTRSRRREIYDECRMRILDRRGDILGTMSAVIGAYMGA